MKSLILIKETVEEVTGIRIKDDPLKTKEVVNARRIYGYLAQKLTRYSLTEIGKVIGRDHSTLVHYQKTTQAFLDNEKDFRDMYNECLNRLPTFDESYCLNEKYKHHLKQARIYRRKLKEYNKNG